MAKVEVEVRGPIFIVTLNRPEVLNAIDFEANDLLIEAWRRFKEDDQLRVAILTGAGERAFCAGADLKTYTQPFARQSAMDFRRRVTNSLGLGGITRNFELFKPIIAAINGHCNSGGLELALACDIRIASTTAQFGEQLVRWGLHACDGFTQRMTWIAGLGTTLYMALTGERIGAQEALRLGIVHEVVEPERLMPRALELAEVIASRAPLAVQAVKEVILRGLGRPLEDALRLESLSFHHLAFTEDAQEGVRAFQEKRQPRFQGR